MSATTCATCGIPSGSTQATSASDEANATNGGTPGSWADVARAVFAHEGRDPADVTPVSTVEYAAGSGRPPAPRPAYSTLDLTRLEATGHEPADQWTALTAFLDDSRP